MDKDVCGTSKLCIYFFVSFITYCTYYMFYIALVMVMLKNICVEYFSV